MTAVDKGGLGGSSWEAPTVVGGAEGAGTAQWREGLEVTRLVLCYESKRAGFAEGINVGVRKRGLKGESKGLGASCRGRKTRRGTGRETGEIERAGGTRDANAQPQGNRSERRKAWGQE